MATHITLCMGSACFARGNRQNLALVREFLREHGLEAEIELRGELCQGRCRQGPRLIIDGTPYERVDPNACLDLLRRHFHQGGPA